MVTVNVAPLLVLIYSCFGLAARRDDAVDELMSHPFFQGSFRRLECCTCAIGGDGSFYICEQCEDCLVSRFEEETVVDSSVPVVEEDEEMCIASSVEAERVLPR